MKKYTKTESGAQVLTPAAHKAAQEALRKQGKTSAANMTDQQREDFSHGIDQAE